MSYLIAALIIIFVISAAVQYPAFGIILLFFIIIFVLSIVRDSKRYKKQEKERKKQLDLKNRRIGELEDEMFKEVASIIENDFQKIAAAYRKTVTENAFGKKNYDKFIPQFTEYLYENSEKMQEWVEENNWNYDDFTDAYIEHAAPGLIEAFELMLQDRDEKMEFSESMDPYEYEQFCAKEFTKAGWNAKTTKASSDQGVDVIAKKGDIKLVAQCKKFTKAVGNKAVQEIVAGIKYYQADMGIVIAPNSFTKSAEKLAAANKIKLIHHSQIKDL